MNNYLILRILDKFQGVFSKFGIDYKVMRKLVELKLTMDCRKVPTILASNSTNKEPEKEKNNFRSAMWMYFIFGIFSAIIMFMPIAVLPKMSIVLGMIIFMIMTTLVADFSSVLLDVKDKNILFPKPISPKTINAAKIIHILNYLISLTIALAGPSLIVGFVKHGVLFGFLFLIELVLINITLILFTALLYFLLLYFFDGEKLKDIINYFQILLSVLIIIGYQLIGRIFEFVDVHIEFTLEWWHGFIPSVLFAAPLSIVGDKDYQFFNIVFSLLAMIIPIVSLVIYMKVIVPYFERNIQKLNDNSSVDARKMERKIKRTKGMAKLICRDREERAAYIFTKNMCSKERDFKLKVYPSLAMSCILPFIFVLIFLGDLKSLSDLRNIFIEGRLHFTIYLATMSLGGLIPMIMYSEKYKASWLFTTLPIKNKTKVLKGSFKGFVFNYEYTVYLFLCAIFILIAGPNIIIDLIISFLALNILSLISFRFVDDYPFSKEILTGNSDNMAWFFVSLGSIALLGIVHYFLVEMGNGEVSTLMIYGAINVGAWVATFRDDRTFKAKKEV